MSEVSREENLETYMNEAERVINIARTVCLMLRGNEHIEVLSGAIEKFDSKVEGLWI